MKKNVIIIISVIIISCKGQTDLELLKFDEKLSEKTTVTQESNKAVDGIYGFMSFETSKLNDYRFGDVTFTEYQVPNAYSYAKSNIYFYVENYESKKYLGFSLYLAKNDEGDKLIDYLKQKYGAPESRNTMNEDESAFFWDLKSDNKWVFLTKKIEKTKNNSNFNFTNLVIVKQGTRVENSKDKDVFTILERFNLTYPKEK